VQDAHELVFEMPASVPRIDEVPAWQLDRHRVDREVAATQVVFDRRRRRDVRKGCRRRVRLRARSRDIDVRPVAVVHDRGSETSVQCHVSPQPFGQGACERFGVADDGEVEVEARRMAEQQIAHGSTHEIRGARQRVQHRREPVERSQLVGKVHLENGDRFDLDECAGRESRHLDRRPSRRPVADVTRINLVHTLEVVEVLQEYRCLHKPVETAARLLENRAQVREHLLRLLLDRPATQLRISRLERKLTRDEHQPAGLDRL
jgi:hypothetical protein